MTKRKPTETETETLEQAESDAAAEAAAIAPSTADAKSDAESDPKAAGAAGANAALEAAAVAQAAGDDDAAGPTSADYSTAFTPRNVAVGLAIVAGLVALAASRHRRKRDAGGGDG